MTFKILIEYIKDEHNNYDTWLVNIDDRVDIQYIIYIASYNALSIRYIPLECIHIIQRELDVLKNRHRINNPPVYNKLVKFEKKIKKYIVNA